MTLIDWNAPFLEFRDRVVLVTGGSTGIGAAVATAFGQAGARVAIHCNASRDAAEQVAASVQASGASARVFDADLSQAGNAARLVMDVAAKLGGLDILINNAGSILGRVPTLEVEPVLYERVMGLNLTAVFAACQAAIPIFLDRGCGVIVNTTSQAARAGGGPGTMAYAAAKAGVATLTRGLAREFADRGIRVNAVSPGVIRTPLHDHHTPAEAMERFQEIVPMRRLGDATDCVGAYLFLSSNRLAGYITGQTIEVNGGSLMY